MNCLIRGCYLTLSTVALLLSLSWSDVWFGVGVLCYEHTVFPFYHVRSGQSLKPLLEVLVW